MREDTRVRTAFENLPHRSGHRDAGRRLHRVLNAAYKHLVSCLSIRGCWSTTLFERTISRRVQIGSKSAGQATWSMSSHICSRYFRLLRLRSLLGSRTLVKRSRGFHASSPRKLDDDDSAKNKSSDPTPRQQSLPTQLVFNRLSTLDPSRLQPSDWMDLMDKCTVFPYMIPRNRLPERASGFLYYHISPEPDPLENQLRFRITDSQDPADFPFGYDLAHSSKNTWQVPLSSIMQRSTYHAALELLLRDKLISTSTVPIFLHSLNQPFPLDFARKYIRFWVPTSDVTLLPGHIDFHALSLHKTHFKGTQTFRVIGQFERSTLAEHEGRRGIVLRILKHLDPWPTNVAINYFLPQEGELLKQFIRRKNVITWACDVDASHSKYIKSLRHLVNEDDRKDQLQDKEGD